jgi:hypothetical protein
MKILIAFFFLFLSFAPLGAMAEPIDPAGCSGLRTTFFTDNALNRGVVNDAEFSRSGIIGANGTICPCAPKPGLLIERIVYCFAAVSSDGSADGIIYKIALVIVDTIKAYYKPLYGMAILIATVFFGIKLTVGDVRKSLPADSFTFVVKLGAVLTFLALFDQILAMALGITQSLASIPADALSGFADICNLGVTNTLLATERPTIWAQWDCVLGKLFGFSMPVPDYLGAPLFMGILGFVLKMALTPPYGPIIALVGIYIFVTFIAALFLMVQTYLMALFAITFLVLLAPLFVPLMLFGLTWDRFNSWLHQLIGYIVQPMILNLFMGIMLVAFQLVVFVKSDSLIGTLTNSNPPTAQAVGVAFDKYGAAVDAPAKRTLGQMQPNPETLPASDASGNTGGNALSYNKAANSILPDVPVVPDSYNAKRDSRENIDTQLHYNNVNTDQLISDLNGRDGAVRNDLEPKSYYMAVLTRMLSTAFLTYMLYAMVKVIPQVVEAISGVNSVDRVMGGKTAGDLFAAGREMVRSRNNIFKGASVGGDSGLVRNVASAAVQHLVGGRK